MNQVRDPSRSLTRQAILVAAACVVADVGSFIVAGPSPSGGPRLWAALVILVVADAALAGPARLSGVVAVLQGTVHLFAGHLIVDGAGDPRSATTAGLLVAGYRAGAWLRSTHSFVALAALVAGVVGGTLLTGQHIGLGAVGFLVIGNALLPWMVGRYTTARRAFLSKLEQQAEQRRIAEEAAVQRAVAEERSAIARDLHDVISHHVSAISVHAGAARLGLGTAEPGTSLTGVARSLAAVEEGTRAAMADLRKMLDILNGTGTGTMRQPGLHNIDELVEKVRTAGLAVELAMRGMPRRVPGSLDIALYRIVQEALTNALRHGDGDSVSVELTYQPGDVVVTVTNPIPKGLRVRTPRDSPARGLAGIRQRVALFGGRITYGTQADGRHWRLQVGFPLEAT
ncbi:sensor histidine kinase [Sinosporangium siamense]|uniref:histidine kinase n=1 Tax=Sinosporangium siamense TaxID=1367973 RepID=A0A919RRH0_9ACTN|nr:histidine kinase [Sinosporangium siamense]GII97394.1 two-component sensor histidine kinase [Sinosporangium siamense]